jgi:hypothetical protein
MRSVYETRSREQTEIERKILQGDARYCSPIFGRVCRTIWPVKTAEHLAAAIGCSVRAAAYQISGESEPSARAVAAVIIEITRR